jgi:pimeloyl-ACP methyl ester carboxylesterase
MPEGNNRPTLCGCHRHYPDITAWGVRMRTIPRLLLAVLLGAGGTVAATAAPAEAATFTVAGTVLSATTATLPPELAPLATGKRIHYVTTNVNGVPIVATGLVLTPKAKKRHKTVVWGHGTTGLADQCAPSNHLDVFWPEARAAIAGLLGRGWTVAAPDYPGLGTLLPHPYLIGASEARSMIDSVRAARNLDPSLELQYVLDGHSEGGQGSLFANQMAPSYDGRLVLRGSAAIAPVSNVDVLAPLIPGTPGQGYLVMALYGLATVDPGFDPDSVLAEPARKLTPVLRTGCLTEILNAYAELKPEELLVNGTLPDAVIAKLGRFDNPAQTPPSAPILIVQGTADDAVPYTITEALVAQLRTYDQPVRLKEIAGASHDEAVFQSVTLVDNWIAARFH